MSDSRVLPSSPVGLRLTATVLQGVSTIEGEGLAATSIGYSENICNSKAEQCLSSNHGVCLFNFGIDRM